MIKITELILYKPNQLKVIPNQTISSEIRVFTAAKEVAVIDAYAENQKIEKFDLTIDWGWFYFFTQAIVFYN